MPDEEDTSDDEGSKALLTTTAGAEIELTGSDADALFARTQLLMDAGDAVLARMQAAAAGVET